MTSRMEREIDRVTLNPNSFADVIKMILNNFLKTISARKFSERKGCLVIDIELLAERDSYIVRITHCGQWYDHIIENLFHKLCLMVKDGLLLNNTILAHVFQRADGEDDETVYEIGGAPNFVKKKNYSKNGFIHFPSFRNYVLIQLQYRLLERHLLEFKEILIRELNILKKSHRDVKITFYFGKDVFYTNHVGSDDDFQNSQLLSFSLTTVIKQSMNTKFKERCLKTLGVHSVHDAQKVLARTMFSITHENYMIP